MRRIFLLILNKFLSANVKNYLTTANNHKCMHSYSFVLTYFRLCSTSLPRENVKNLWFPDVFSRDREYWSEMGLSVTFINIFRLRLTH